MKGQRVSDNQEHSGGRGDPVGAVVADLPGSPHLTPRPHTDRIVFGVSAALTIGFVI